jgi:hypothetical protein
MVFFTSLHIFSIGFITDARSDQSMGSTSVYSKSFLKHTRIVNGKWSCWNWITTPSKITLTDGSKKKKSKAVPLQAMAALGGEDV